MTAIRLTTEETAHSDVLAGPETFDPPTITVVDGWRIRPLRPQATPIPGCATLFRLGGDAFGMMHEVVDLHEVDGRILGDCREPVEIGTLVTIGWESTERAACRGVVAFCRREGDRWRLTIELDSALAA